MIITLAGRRVDQGDARETRFPVNNATEVQQQIRAAFMKLNAQALVCAAACGADILALEVAGELGIRRHIVLPYDRLAFRASSVVDCPGDWGGRFDRIISDVEARKDLIVYDYDQDDDATYFATNHDILDNAEEIAQKMGEPLTVLVVWNGEPSGANDVTGHFLEEAKRRGLHVTSIGTL
jgi:hypothetical protein